MCLSKTQTRMHFLIIRILYVLKLTFPDLTLIILLMDLSKNLLTLFWYIHIQDGQRSYVRNLPQSILLSTTTVRYSPVIVYKKLSYSKMPPNSQIFDLRPFLAVSIAPFYTHCQISMIWMGKFSCHKGR
ncbi:unnamed protein product [Hymenolepis diminuta]|uniref:Uncharacterized protein n=1 Tax=Hymenolepis diminuta TaxID=6216 RepID=A0A564YV73_HYMDI|nr:unnamed protein product [Hymenolepis diminuta]